MGIKKRFISDILLAWFLSLSVFCNNEPHKSTLPLIKYLDRYTATITWTTEKAMSGMITYFQEGKEKKRVIEKKSTKNHTIKITGLLPDNQYYYMINSLPKKEFTFRTAPLSSSSFRFCIINQGTISVPAIEQFFPDFLIIPFGDANNVNFVEKELEQLNTRIPFYPRNLFFVWSNLLFQPPQATDSTLISQSENLTRFTIYDSLSHAPTKEETVYHILTYLGGDSISVVLDSFMTEFITAQHSMLFEVQGEEISAGIIGSAPDKPLPYQLKKGSLSYTKTCILCRRLLENRQYQKSIAYYKRFIENNPEQQIHVDAFFRIATIYDRYLFDYKQAISAYQQLLERYPESSFSKQADFRLQYIQQHADFDFTPLKTFEKAKRHFDKDSINSSIAPVEAILNQYSTCSLRDDMLLWLGNILAETDKEKAVTHLTLVSQKTNDPAKRYKASLKIGDIYYQHNQYRDALEVYATLLNKFPEKSATLEIKMNRSKRNQKRKIGLWICALFLILLPIIISTLPQKGLKLPTLKWAFLSGCAYILAFIIPFLIYYQYLITLKAFTISLCISMILVLYFSWLLAVKLSTMPLLMVIKISINGCVTLMTTCSVLYIHFYLFHFLFIIERVLK